MPSQIATAESRNHTLGQKLNLSFIPVNNDLGLFLLRLLVALNLFLKHGWEKIFSFSDVVARVPDVLHIGVPLTIALASVSDFFCATLIMIGLATRWACVYCFVVISIAWVVRDHFIYWGRTADHGELIALYLSGLIAIFFTGPGRFSLDAKIRG